MLFLQRVTNKTFVLSVIMLNVVMLCRGAFEKPQQANLNICTLGLGQPSGANYKA